VRTAALALLACSSDDDAKKDTDIFGPDIDDDGAAAAAEEDVVSQSADICELAPEDDLTALLAGPAGETEGTTYADGGQRCVWTSESRTVFALARQTGAEEPPDPPLPDEGGCVTASSGEGWAVKVGLAFSEDPEAGTLPLCEALMDALVDALVEASEPPLSDVCVVGRDRIQDVMRGAVAEIIPSELEGGALRCTWTVVDTSHALTITAWPAGTERPADAPVDGVAGGVVHSTTNEGERWVVDVEAIFTSEPEGDVQADVDELGRGVLGAVDH